jgi:hypothetical protein
VRFRRDASCVYDLDKLACARKDRQVFPQHTCLPEVDDSEQRADLILPALQVFVDPAADLAQQT